MSLPEKLIAVGMRYNPGAERYLRDMQLPQNVALRTEVNKEASGGIAIAVYHKGNKLAYIREADLGQLKRELYLGSTYQDFSSNKYDITQKYPNYLVLKLSKSAEEYNTYKQEYEAEYTTACAIPVSAEILKTLQKPMNIKKEETMFDKIIAANKTVAVTAAYMEAGRIANNQVAKIVAAKAPLMVKGYVDTPVGKLVLANLTSMAVEQFRPTDARLKKVSNAMMSAAYQELIQTVDIEGMLNELTSSEGIKNALAAVAGQEEVAVKA
jgi:hypothetical protein